MGEYGAAVGFVQILVGNGVVLYLGGIEQILVPGIIFREDVNSCAAVVSQAGKVVEQTFCVKSYPHTSSGDQTIELAPRMAASDSFSEE